MRIAIIGNDVGHEVQKIHTNEDNAERKEFKHQFESFLRRQVAERGVQFIGEEADRNFVTIAKHLSDDLGLPFPWVNIDMSELEREEKGIAENQTTRPRGHGFDEDACTQLIEEGFQTVDGNGWVTIEYRVESDTIREEHMVNQVTLSAPNATSVLVICGILHSQELAKRFRQKFGNQVEVLPWTGGRVAHLPCNSHK